MSITRWGRQRSLHLFEPEVEFFDDDPKPEKPKARFSFHVTRPKEFGGQTLGGNRSGTCSVAEVQRSGTLVIHAEHGKRFFFPAGTWIECTTEPRNDRQGHFPLESVDKTAGQR